MEYPKKLIEVALPLELINDASRREKNPFVKNHPRAIHVWWARRPLAACRAVLFAQLVDDPSCHPGLFPTEESQRDERARLFRIIEELVKWENTYSEQALETARKEILKSTNDNPPPILDPFCGAGSIPLEAQRLGLTTYASDINPVAVLITKALIEIPSRFAEKPPVHPGTQESPYRQGAKGLAEDVRYYGKWMRGEAVRQIGYLYPKVKLPKEFGGGEVTAIAWLWARTVTCPNPACGAHTPLVRSFDLSVKRGKRAWVQPTVEGNKYHFEVKTGDGSAQEGTVNRRGATCLCCGTPVPFQHIRSEGKTGRMGTRLLAIVTKGPGGRIYLRPNEEQELVASQASPEDAPDTQLPEQALGFRVQQYGMTTHRDLFTPRQLIALNTLSELVIKARERVLKDAIKAGFPGDSRAFNDGGNGATGYADAVATFLGLAVSRFCDFSNTLCSWDSGNTNMRQLFARQAIPMVWDFAETNPLEGVVNIDDSINWAVSAFEKFPYTRTSSRSMQLDASTSLAFKERFVIATDPPYYDNIGYADLSDLFYIWLRKSLKEVYPDLFGTMLVPKAAELVANPYRFDGDKNRAEQHFESGLNQAFSRLCNLSHIQYPLTIYYAFKQSERERASDGDINIFVSTGWETMLEGLIKAGLSITGTWPMRTEQAQRSVAMGTNALASSILLVCRPRPGGAPMTTRRDLLNVLKRELAPALKTLQEGSIAPVDLAQAAIGPGMAIFSRYSKVLEADGTPMRVRAALALINQVLDEYLTAQEGEYDADTRWALAWFEQHGMEEGPFGVAETLSKAKNTAVDGLVEAGILQARAGKVRLLRRDEFRDDWDPAADKRLTVWEVTQYLIRALVDQGSEEKAADLLRKVGAFGDVARDLAYRLYTICDRKKWTQEALAYNSLVVAWPELLKLAGQQVSTGPTQAELF